MKRLVIISVVLSILHFAGYNPVKAQNAGNLPLEQCSYLISKRDVIIVGMDSNAVNFDPEKIALILPGAHTLEVLLQTTMQGGQGGPTTGSTARSGNVSVSVSVNPGAFSSSTIYSSSVKINAVLEQGKYYTFDYKKIHKGIFKNLNVPDSIVEITDYKRIEKAKEILEKENGVILSSNWSKTHPQALEGTYKTQNGKAEITFSGNTFHISAPAIIKSPFVYDGTFLFNEKMITLKIDSLKTGKSERKPWNKVAFLHYKLNNEMLDITLQTDAVSMVPSVKGLYYSSSVMKTSGSIHIENTEKDAVNVVNVVTENDASTTVSKVVPVPPALLEGNYKTDNNKKQISFTGNTFHLSLPALIGHYVYDGTFSYDNETITLNVDSYKNNKIRMSLHFTVILSFKLDGNMLDISDVKDINGSSPMALSSAKGQYHKSSE